jgi:hypothetical protein
MAGVSHVLHKRSVLQHLTSELQVLLEDFVIELVKKSGRARAQAVSRWPLTAEARVRARANPCGICGGQSGTGTDFAPSSSVFPCHYHSTSVPCSYII